MAEKAIELKQHKEYLGNIDPFEIPLDYYKSLTGDEDWFLTNRLFSLYGNWIQTKFEENSAESLVLCNRKVVYASKNRYEPIDEWVTELEAKMGKPCYVVTREPLIEERARWSELQRGDYCSVTLKLTGRAGVANFSLRYELTQAESLLLHCYPTCQY